MWLVVFSCETCYSRAKEDNNNHFGSWEVRPINKVFHHVVNCDVCQVIFAKWAYLLEDDSGDKGTQG